MLTWHHELNTGQNNKYLRGIAGEDVCILAPRNSSKAQPLWEQVLTPNGWVCMGDIKIGDYVVSVDGLPTKVIDVHSHGIKDTYELTTSADAKCYCSFDHRWLVLDRFDGQLKELPTHELWHTPSRYKLPTYKTGEFDDCIQEIKYVSRDEHQCITVDHPSGLYVTRDYIVTHNSTFLLQWVAYVIGTHVMQGISLKILYISYAVDAAIGKSRQIKAIIQSEPYQEVFPKVHKSPSKWGEGEWAIDFEYAGLSTIEEAYTLVCAGLKGSINSRRCLDGDTLVKTRIGDISIKELEDKIGLEVLSFNHQYGDYEWKKITGFSKTKSNSIHSILTANNNKLWCTPDHRIYECKTSQYQDASTLKIGDALLSIKGIDFYKSLVSFSGGMYDTYDIEVEDNHNFFANNILVHNCHICVIDDPQKDIDEARNKSIQDRMESNYNNILKYTRYDGSRFITLGTRMAKHDAYSRIFVPPYYKIVTQKALIEEKQPDGSIIERSFWEPSDDNAPGLRLETLLKERTEDEESFLLQRQNELPETTSLNINRAWIKYGWIPKKFDRIVIGADTADSTEENTNATAFVVVGISNDCLYVIDAYEGKIAGNVKKIDQIYDLWLKRKSDCKHPAILAVDQHRWSKGLSGDFNTYVDDLHHDDELDTDFANISIERISSSGRGEKIERLLSHSYYFEKGRVFFNLLSPKSESGVDLIPRIVTQITDHNPIDHNDLMDALEVAIYVARQYITGNISVA